MMKERLTTVREVFEEAQGGFRHHTKLVEAMKKIQKQYLSEDEFRDNFVDHLKHALVEIRREPAFERIIEFAAKFSTARENLTSNNKKDEVDASDCEPNSSEFLRFMLTFLVGLHDAGSKAIRFRACQMIGKLLDSMDDNAFIDDDLADSIFEAMLTRLQDKIPTVRSQAVAALSRLQDPSNDQCPIIAAYLQLLCCDSSPDVRRAVLLNIAVTTSSLPVIIERTHDIAVPVRKLAYRVLAEKVNIRSFKIAQRISLLRTGLNDQAESVKEICIETLLEAWLKVFEGSAVKLLKALDVENAEEVAETVLKAVFKGMTSEALREYIRTLKSDDNSETRETNSDTRETMGVSLGKLDGETAFYWCKLAQHLKTLGVEGDELLDMFLPEMSELCDYIQSYVDKHLKEEPGMDCEPNVQQIFIVRQLLTLVGGMDLSDEVGRKRLMQLVHDLLVSTEVSELLVPTLHSCYVAVQPDEEARIQEMVEIIADVRQPIVMTERAQTKEEQRQQELKLAGIKVKLNQLRDEMEESVSKQEFNRAADLKQMIAQLEEEKDSLTQDKSLSLQVVREEKDDPITLLKCLTIASEVLQMVTRNELNPTLTTLLDTLILSGVQNEDPAVRNAAIECLGLCCLLSCSLARTYLVLFLQVAQLDHEAIQMTALKSVFDLLLMFGLEAFKDESTPEALNQESAKEKEEGEEEEEEEEDEDEEIEQEEEQEEQEGNKKEDFTKSLLDILTEQLESECNSVRDVTAEGFTKLMFTGRVQSAKLLSRLILLWYNPTSEGNVHLWHCIGGFLPAFAFASRSNQELVEETFLPTLRTLFNAPEESPLAAVNVFNVAELLLELTNSSNLNRNRKGSLVNAEGSIHASLAVKVANEILCDPDASGMRVLCKVLTMMDLSGCDQSFVKDMKVLCNQMMQEIKDTKSVKLLQKLEKQLVILDDHGCNVSSQSATDQNAQEAASDCTNGLEEKTQEIADTHNNTVEQQQDGTTDDTTTREESEAGCNVSSQSATDQNAQEAASDCTNGLEEKTQEIADTHNNTVEQQQDGTTDDTTTREESEAGYNVSSQSATDQNAQEAASDCTNGLEEKTQDIADTHNNTVEQQQDGTTDDTTTREESQAATTHKPPDRDQRVSAVPKSRTRNTNRKKSSKSKSVAPVTETSSRVTRSAVRKRKTAEPAKVKLNMELFDSSSDDYTHEDEQHDVFDGSVTSSQ